jgi:hypothetical protein
VKSFPAFGNPNITPLNLNLLKIYPGTRYSEVSRGWKNPRREVSLPDSTGEGIKVGLIFLQQEGAAGGSVN